MKSGTKGQLGDESASRKNQGERPGDPPRAKAATFNSNLVSQSSDRDSNYVDQMDKSAISAHSAFNVEQKMQELKKKKSQYLNQGNDSFNPATNNQFLAQYQKPSQNPEGRAALDLQQIQFNERGHVNDTNSEQLNYQFKDAKFQSQVPTSPNPIVQDNDRLDEMIRLEQQVVMSSLMKTSDQELIAYDQEDDYEGQMEAAAMQQDNNNNVDHDGQTSEGLTQNIDKLNKAYNSQRVKTFDGAQINQSNTDYVNSRYHQTSKQRIDLANRLTEQDQISTNRRSIQSANKNDRGSASKSQKSQRMTKADRKARKQISQTQNPFNISNVSLNQPDLEEQPRNSQILKKERQVPHLSLNIVGSTLQAAKNQSERLKESSLKGVSVGPKPSIAYSNFQTLRGPPMTQPLTPNRPKDLKSSNRGLSHNASTPSILTQGVVGDKEGKNLRAAKKSSYKSSVDRQGNFKNKHSTKSPHDQQQALTPGARTGNIYKYNYLSKHQQSKQPSKKNSKSIMPDPLNDDIMNVFREDEEDFDERYRAKKVESPDKPHFPLDLGNKSVLSKTNISQVSHSKSQAMNDLTSGELMPLFNDQRIEKKLIEDQKRHKEETAKKNKDKMDQESGTQLHPGTAEKGKLPSYPIESMRQNATSPLLIGDFTSSAPQDFTNLLMHQEAKFNQLQLENERLKHFLPDSYTEMRLRERQLQERMCRYEQNIIDYENEKKIMCETIKQKDEDILFIKGKYEETNSLWHQENKEKQKLEAIIEQQYKESMEMDTMRRKAEDERNFEKNKNKNLRIEVEELIKENQRINQEKAQLNSRLHSLRQVKKQQEKKLEQGKELQKNNKVNAEMERRMQQSELWAQELEEKLSFTVDKFEEQNKRFLECGKELAEAQEKLERQDIQIAEFKEKNRVLQAQLDGFKVTNLGPGSPNGLNAIPEESNGDIAILNTEGKSKEAITIDFLKQQNEAQLAKIRYLESKKSSQVSSTSEDLLRQVNMQNQKIAKLNQLHSKMNDQKKNFSIREEELKEEILSLQRKLQGSKIKQIGGMGQQLNSSRQFGSNHPLNQQNSGTDSFKKNNYQTSEGSQFGSNNRKRKGSKQTGQLQRRASPKANFDNPKLYDGRSSPKANLGALHLNDRGNNFDLKSIRTAGINSGDNTPHTSQIASGYHPGANKQQLNMMTHEEQLEQQEQLLQSQIQELSMQENSQLYLNNQ